ncbi:MAG: hypothetical protein COS87_01640 [Chloroflexi bacterium CG07_land_8_20_14_0_80_45_17]|nr:MAG: hypothetical protein COS87_01640 [Chloroflexi bacterium CG07_land_8_20_14_0_80_45_17]
MPGLKVNAYFVTLSNSEGSRFFGEPILVSRSSERSEEEILRSLLSLRMTRGEGLRMTGSEGLRAYRWSKRRKYEIPSTKSETNSNKRKLKIQTVLSLWNLNLEIV